MSIPKGAKQMILPVFSSPSLVGHLIWRTAFFLLCVYAVSQGRGYGCVELSILQISDLIQKNTMWHDRTKYHFSAERPRCKCSGFIRLEIQSHNCSKSRKRYTCSMIPSTSTAAVAKIWCQLTPSDAQTNMDLILKSWLDTTSAASIQHFEIWTSTLQRPHAFAGAKVGLN